MELSDLVDSLKVYSSKGLKRVLVVTHRACLDGVGCQIVATNIFNRGVCEYVLINPTDLREYLYNKLDKILQEYDLVLVVDVSLDDSFDYYNDKVFFIDHHSSSSKFASLANVYFNESHCASVLFAGILSKVFSKDLSYLGHLLKLIEEHDLWKHTCTESLYLSYIFYRIWNEDFIDRFRNGFREFTEEEKSIIASNVKEFKEHLKSAQIFECEKIKGAIVYGKKFINEISHYLLKKEGYGIVFFRNTTNNNVSIRSTIEGFDLGKYLRENIKDSGGQSKAGAFRINAVEDFRNNVENLEKYILKNFPKVVK